jgi:uncharacterized protein
MIKRLIIDELLQWKNAKKPKPLILRGARQVGKTTAVFDFAKNYKQFIALNLELANDAKLFLEEATVENIISEIFFTKGKKLSEANTLIFIDEIQAVPEALNMLRYFYEVYPQYHFIAAVSMLETILNEKVKIPVGRVTYKILRPLSFKEFLIGLNETEVLNQYDKIPQDDFAINKTMQLFNTYTQIGGMPEVVNRFIETKDVTTLQPIYEDIWASYISDVEKYARNTSMVQVIRHVIQNLSSEAGSRIKFQHFGNSNYKSREVGEALRTLEKALLLHLVYPTISAELPAFSDKKKSPRLQFIDTGLLNFNNKTQSLFYSASDISNIYKGSIIEHIVGQEILVSNFSVLHEIQFWTKEKKDATAEIDYILLHENNLIPIEVKQGATGTLKSLHLYMDIVSHNWAIRLYNGPIKIDELKTSSGKKFYLLNLPHYLGGKLYEYITWFKKERI